MKLREVMTTDPVVVGPETDAEQAREIMRAGAMHHLPIMDGAHLVGMWVATDAGPVVLLGPEHVYQASPDDSADEALAVVIGDDAVVATADGAPVGLVTRRNVMNLVREGLRVAPRLVPPLVVRFVGPAGSGKTTVLTRTLVGLKRRRVGVVEANPEPPERRLGSRVAGAPVVYAPDAHWRKGFRNAIEQMGGVELVLVEDRDQRAHATVGLGEDVQVIVCAAADIASIDVASLVDAQAVVITKPDEVVGFDAHAEQHRLRAANGNLAVFVVGAQPDDPGCTVWQQWLDARLVQHRR